MFEHHSKKISVREKENRVKVVTFGSYHSGKTTFIRSIDPKTRSTEARNLDGETTVAFDLGVKEYRGYKIYLYGTPGQDRFVTAREVVSFGLHAGIVIVDSVRGITGFEKQILDEMKAHNIPCVVIANKMDLPGASLEKVVEGCGADTCVIPVSASTGQGVNVVLDKLAEIASQIES